MLHISMTQFLKQTTSGTFIQSADTHNDHHHFFTTCFLRLPTYSSLEQLRPKLDRLGEEIEGHSMLMHSYNIQLIHNLHNGESMFVTLKYISLLKDLIAKENPC